MPHEYEVILDEGWVDVQPGLWRDFFCIGDVDASPSGIKLPRVEGALDTVVYYFTTDAKICPKVRAISVKDRDCAFFGSKCDELFAEKIQGEGGVALD